VKKPPIAAYAALVAICIIWGTVYPVFGILVQTIPPVLLMGGRFFFAGLITLAVAAAVGAKMPTGKEFLASSFYGLLTLGLGIGTLAIAVTKIPSGLVAMMSTTTPFWMVGIEAMLRGGDRPNLKTILGMLMGLAGTLLWVVPDALREGLGGSVFVSFVILQLGCAGFAVGSILERRHKTTTHPIINGAVQELATGVAFLIPALVTHQTAQITVKSGLLVLYLIIFGGIVAYSSYLYAMKNLPVSLVSIYIYVNPLVAVTLGWFLFGQGLGTLGIIGMFVVFAGILIVKRNSVRPGHEGN